MMKKHLHIAENVIRLKERVAECADKVKRRASEITPVAVAKNRTIEEVDEVVRAGISLIGENRVQEALNKYTHSERDFTLRFIGHLQANKAVKAADFFDTIDSVDSIRLAERLNGALAAGRQFPILLQVNTSGEKSKSGFSPEKIGEALEEISNMENLSVGGLMTIGPLTSEKKVIRGSFQKMRELFEGFKSKYGLTVLSMGMTEDFNIAIQEGSTMIRVGRALFERGWL